MKNVMNVVAAAVVGGAVAYATVHFAQKNQNLDGWAPLGQAGVPVRQATLNSMAPEKAIDFTEAAEFSINGVVHVKTVTRGRQVQSYNPFFHFFQDYGMSQPRMGSGSGVIVSPDGHIITNNHVVAGADEVEVTLNDKRSFPAKVVSTDPNTDLAVLKIEGRDLPYIPYGNSDDVRVGEWVLAVGNPFNLTSTVTAGIVSAKGRNINILQEEMAIESFIQTDAAVNPGNSGGALVNTRGELIGINTAIASNTGSYAGYSFAVPVNIARKVVDDLISFGEVQRAFIGVSIRDISGKFAEERGLATTEGAYINGLTDGGAAEKAGLKEGDIITAINGIKVRNVPELQEKIGAHRPGEMVDVAVVRDGQAKTFRVELRNRDGGTDVVSTRAADIVAQLGAQLTPITDQDRARLRISGGMKVTSVGNGKLRSAGVREGFIITRIDRKAVHTADDVLSALGKKKGGVLIEGVYPNGLTAYYGFGM